MTVRKKAFGAIALVFILVSLILYGASTLIIQKQFETIETADTQKNTERVVDALNNNVSDLATKSGDWSNWDDTYRFIVDHNQAYVTSNLSNSSIASLGLNFMLFYDAQEKLVQVKGIDSNGNDLSVPAALLTYFQPGSQLFTKTVTTTHTGFLNVAGKPLYFSIRPILTSDAIGPVHGTLVFAKYLDAADTAKLARITHLTVQFYNYGGTIPADVQQIDGQLRPNQVVIKRVSANTIEGYSELNDVQGVPLIIVRVQLPRQTFNQAQKSIRYFLLVIASLTFLAIVLATYITNQVFARDKVIRVKDEFFSVASHELRTPLTVIRGNADMLQDFYDNRDTVRFRGAVTVIADSSMRLVRLVNNFLDAARFEHGEVPLSPEPLSLHDIAASLVEEMQGLAHEKHIEIQSIISPKIPIVFADPDRVKQIIYNLVGNAAKFTERGSVTLSAVPYGNMVKVYVTDTGRGISPADQKILFQKFHQTKSSDSKTGSGLGLYISKVLVELMGGHIALEVSAVGQGTTVSFSLPVATIGQLANFRNNVSDKPLP